MTIVWDLPTRIFHWTLVACVLVAWATAEDSGILLRIHAVAGHGVLALVAFRIVWGLVGSRHSRFADFVRPWAVVRDYIAGLLRFRPADFTGHNPLGGWMIVLLLAWGIAVALSGVLSLSVHAFENLHEALANIFLVLAGIHVCGVLVDMLLTGDNLVRAMIDGRKSLHGSGVASERDGLAPVWLGIVLGATTLALWVWLVATTDFPAG